MADPWKAESLGAGRYRFMNVSGGKLVMITLSPIGGAEVSVENSPIDPHAVPAPVDADASFVAVVRGAGVRITATVPPSMRSVYWELAVS